MKRWPFVKYVGCGNDFILFDSRQEQFPLSLPLVQRLCQRQRGIGADGLLLLENSNQADFRLRIFNCDGSEAEMCGNGIRCSIKWLIDQGDQQSVYRVEVMHQHILTASSSANGNVCVAMGNPRHIQWNIPLHFENRSFLVHYLDTGVPHVVLLMEDIEALDFLKLGNFIRHFPLWQPKGTNVTVAQTLGPQRMKIRTYERGIEGETLACGTGATAAALAAAQHYHFASPICLETLSGEELYVEFDWRNQTFSQITLTGRAACLFRGDIDLEILS